MKPGAKSGFEKADPFYVEKVDKIENGPPRVSVVVPVYNRSVFLGQTIEGVLRQSCPDWELIVVDDGSTEDIGGFLAAYAEGRIRLVRQENQGNAAARNRGAGESRGEFLAFLDSDDVWHADFLTACLESLAANPQAAVSYSRWEYISSDGRLLPKEYRYRRASQAGLLEKLILGMFIYPSAALIRRSVFERVGGFDRNLDDWDLWLRLAAQGYEFVPVERKLLSYRLHPGNLSRSYEVRQAIHFATLDKFFSSPHADGRARSLRDQAYALQHARFGMLAFQGGKTEAGLRHLEAAFTAWPQLLDEPPLYFEIAAAPYQQGEGVRRGMASMDEGADFLQAVVRQVGANPALAARRRRLWSLARLALGIMYYSYSQEYGKARGCLVASALAWPPVLWKTRHLAFFLRSLAGKTGAALLRQRRA